MLKNELPQNPLGRAETPAEETRTAEDYKNALEVVEEIRQKAQEEPLTRKVLLELARLATRSGYGVLKCLTFITAGEMAGVALAGMEEEKKHVLEKLSDAASELKRLEAEAAAREKN